MDIKSRVIAISACLLALLNIQLARATENKETIDSIRTQLPEADSSADTLAILTNIYDASPFGVKTPVGLKAFDMAVKHGHDRLAADLLCNMALINLSNDSILNELKKLSAKIADEDYRHIAETYVWLRQAGYLARYAPTKERIKRIQEAIESGHFRHTNDPYEKMSALGSLCILMGGSNVNRNIIIDYLDEIVDFVDMRPQRDYYLRNIIYNYAAITYSHLGKPEKSAATALKRLKLIDEYVDESIKEGRPYNTFKYVYYVTYQTLLKNYEALTPEQIEEFYSKTQMLAASDVDAANLNKIGEPRAYYLMANHRYKEAIPLLWHVVDNAHGYYVNSRALAMLMDAARKCGDDKTLLEATTTYNRLLEKQLETDAQEAYTKMQVLFDFDELQTRNSQLAEIQAEQLSKSQKTRFIAAIAALLLMMAAVLIMVRQYRRVRKLAKSLTTSNEALRQEGETLKKTQLNLIVARDKATKAERLKSEFIDNMSHEITTPLEAIVEYSQLIVDCVDSEKKKYLARYGDIVTLNASLLQNIVNDIFEIGSLEGKELSIKKAPVSVHELCHMAIASLTIRQHPEVELKFTGEKDPDIIIVTDSKRVEQVLINMLSNADKFAERGTVELTYTIDRENNTISFIVTDEGPGIPQGKEEEIFQRFAKLDKLSQGIGLGLPICRMIANLLQGTIDVDTDYDRGARFVFTIPIL